MRDIDELKEQMIAYDNCLKEDKEAKPLDLTKEEIEEIVDKCVLIPHDVADDYFSDAISEAISDNASYYESYDGEQTQEYDKKPIPFELREQISSDVGRPYENYDILIDDNTLIPSPVAYHKDAKDFYSVEDIIEDVKNEFENLTESEDVEGHTESYDMGHVDTYGRTQLVTETYEAYTETTGPDFDDMDQASREIVDGYYQYVNDDFDYNQKDADVAQRIAESVSCFDYVLKDVNPELRLKDENNENVFETEKGYEALAEMIRAGETKPLAEYFNDVSSKVSNEDLAHSAKVFSSSFEKMDKTMEKEKEQPKEKKAKDQVGLGNC